MSSRPSNPIYFHMHSKGFGLRASVAVSGITNIGGVDNCKKQDAFFSFYDSNTPPWWWVFLTVMGEALGEMWPKRPCDTSRHNSRKLCQLFATDYCNNCSGGQKIYSSNVGDSAALLFSVGPALQLNDVNVHGNDGADLTDNKLLTNDYHSLGLKSHTET
ncbi:unnamed protein product [Peronospora destructor]|uniref:Uncharacterized protein n=1 Tax=Peronospora destructor TaxID=86335 RepID=A0AAV0V9G6_9STRA|nr:unnamed protein product [Peronospora destructor]